MSYEGDFRDENGFWIWEGQGTQYIYPDEDDPQQGMSVYQGSMKDGQAEGFGRYTVNDGSIWEGYFKAGDFTGIGYWQGAYVRREGKFEDWSLVDGADHIGLSAGASAPETLVEDVVSDLRQRYQIDISEHGKIRETVNFKLPAILAS